MPGKRRIGRASPLLRGGAVLGLVMAGVGVIWLGQSPSQAESPVLMARQAGVFKAKDKLLFSIGVNNPDAKELRGTLAIELRDARGRSVGRAKQEVIQRDAAASYGFELPLTGLPADQVTLRCQFGDKEQFSAKVSDLLLAKAHETSLASGQEFVAGSTASLRCNVQAVKSITETMPLAGAEVTIRLKDKNGKGHDLYAGKAGADGVAAVEFKMPALPAG